MLYHCQKCQMKGIGCVTASQVCWMILLVMNICRNKKMFTLQQKLRWQEQLEQSCTYPMDLLETVYLWTERLYFISSLIHELEIHPLWVTHSHCMPCPCVSIELSPSPYVSPTCMYHVGNIYNQVNSTIPGHIKNQGLYFIHDMKRPLLSNIE